METALQERRDHLTLTRRLAWHYKYYEKEQTPKDRERYAAAENEARARRIGLWQDREAVPPWEWRQAAKQ